VVARLVGWAAAAVDPWARWTASPNWRRS
jgi:hypothetical protein